MTTPEFGWTTDPATLAILSEIYGTDDQRLLDDRKGGGVHLTWLWPLGHAETLLYESNEPVFSRVDVIHGRSLSRGCAFLVWDYGDHSPRPGTLQDADWLRRGVRGETDRRREEHLDAQHRDLWQGMKHTLTSSVTVSTSTVAAYQTRVAAFKDHPERHQALSDLLNQLSTLTPFESLRGAP